MQQTPVQVKKKPLDGVFTALAVIFFLGGFYLIDSIFLAGSAWYVRFGVVIVALLLSIGSLSLTGYREKFVSLFKGARVELRKVHWPSKDEAVKTTLMVLAIVAVFAIFLSIIDWLLALIIRGIM
ncbi:preprotein translocase subunit SecE [Cardiobacteriaceae bacterium TAE3-ERU3]|nr:preprotein translocase subunit SecE [Cardiobacteriaceae bacterium TAE3-ERU3]